MRRSVVIVAALCGCAATVEAGPTFTRKAGPVGKKPTSTLQPGVTDAFPFTDNFDTYANGSNLGGQGGWQKWEAASVEAIVTNAQSVSAPNSFKVNPLSDVTQRGNVTTGKWELKCMTYYPSTNVGPGANDGGFIIGLNQMDAVNPNTQPIGYWSAQVQWHPGTGRVRNYDDQAGVSTPIVTNQWVPFRMVIDLGTDKYDAYYNNVQFVTQRAWSTGTSPTGGIVAVACFDFFSGNAAATVPFELFFDDVSFTQVASCYANCDGSTGTPKLTGNDFTCFINAFATNQSYANCDGSTGTPALTGNDFTCFINAYATALGCS